MSLCNRLRPWYGLMLVTFLVGTAVSLGRADAVTQAAAFRAVLAGLFSVVIFQFTVGNVWGYAVEYANAGGSWTDAPFLAPFAVALGGLATVFLAVRDPFAALWTGFWAFVVTAAVVALVVRFYAGYREGRSEPVE
jgi:hypothetical protein